MEGYGFVMDGWGLRSARIQASYRTEAELRRMGMELYPSNNDLVFLAVHRCGLHAVRVRMYCQVDTDFVPHGCLEGFFVELLGSFEGFRSLKGSEFRNSLSDGARP